MENVGKAQQSHDWVKGKGPTGGTQIEGEVANEQEISKALKRIGDDNVLMGDKYALKVVKDGGVVIDSKGGQEIVVDLSKFLDARRAFLTSGGKIVSIDPILRNIASEYRDRSGLGPDEGPTRH